MTKQVVISNFAYCLAHVPDLVRYGSKPRREIRNNPALLPQLQSALRSYEEARSYPPNQTYIGNLSPEELGQIPRPWSDHPTDPGNMTSSTDPFGEILDQTSFLALLKIADQLNPPLYQTDGDTLSLLLSAIQDHFLLARYSEQLQQASDSAPPVTNRNNSDSHLAITSGHHSFGVFSGDNRVEGQGDDNLSAVNLLENLCSKASGSLALDWLLHRAGLQADQVDLILSCGEEACGDRYQRGGGGMAKSIGEMCGCTNSSGMDIKNFCAAPASAIVTAAAFVRAGLCKRVVVVGGGSLAKLGMKFLSFLENDKKILEDCLASVAFLITTDDSKSPIIRMEPGAVGTVPVGASTSDESVFRHYLLHPLKQLGLTCHDIDRFATELQNPEIMEYAGSGDIAAKNYRKIAAMAVIADQLDKQEMNDWIAQVGMVGFAPTQGHVPSAVPYIGHGARLMARGKIKRAMFLARASLFLNRCTSLMDGVSFILESNPQNAQITGE